MSRKAVILRWVVAAVALAAGLFLSRGVKLSDQAFDLLPGEAVRGDLRLLQRMGLVDRLYITVSASHQDGIPAMVSKKELQESTSRLGDRLAASGYFSYVLSRLPQGYEFSLFANLQPSLPLLFDDKDLPALAELISPEGIKNGLQKSFTLLNSPAGIALKKQVQFDPLGFMNIALGKLKLMRSEYAIQLEDGFFMSRDGMSCLLVAESGTSLTDSARAKAINALFEDATRKALAPGVEASVIGSLPHTLANSRAVETDLRVLLPVATVLMLLLYGVALRNIRFLVVVAVPYLAAPLAIGLTSLFYHRVSGLALGFGIVLLGITVDVATHLYLAITYGGGSRKEAMKQVAEPLFYAVLTTLAVFVVLLFSQVPCHRQMALLAIFGVLLATGLAYLIIPMIARPRKEKSAGSSKHAWLLKHDWLAMFTPKRPLPVLLVWLLLLLAGMMAWPRLHYNGDLRGLDVADSRVKADERHFSDTWGGGDEQAFVLATGSSLDEVLDRNYLVYSFLRERQVKKFQSFAPLLPGPEAQQRNRQAWRQFWEQNRDEFEQRFAAAARDKGFTAKAFEPFFAWLSAEPKPLSPDQFLGGPMQPLFSSMLKVPKDGEPSDLAYLAMTTVAVDDQLLPALLRFAQANDGVKVLASKKWRGEVEDLLRHDVLVLSFFAALLIALMVIYEFRDGRAVVASLAPVLSSLAAMSVFCYLTDGQLNMMHLIMGLMVIGVSVDYGIFVVCDQLAGQEKVSIRSVSLTAASTLIGFGVLAFAVHPALYALGVTVLVGIGVAWPTALFVCPALLAFGKKGKA